MDLLEKLKENIGCAYISDLRFAPWRERARSAIAELDLQTYPLTALSDAADYLYGEARVFAGVYAAQTYFRDKLCEGRDSAGKEEA